MNKRKKQKYLWIVLIALVVVCVAAAATLWLQDRQRKIKETQEAVKQMAQNDESDTSDSGSYVTYDGQRYEYNTDLKTILFLGVDKTQEATVSDVPGDGGQSDCIILMVMNTKDKTTTLVEVSRDSMTDIAIYGPFGDYISKTKAQVALQYAYGDGEKRSCQLSKDAVANLMYGIPIRSYISLNISGITSIVDAMGGVEITVPEDYTSIDPAFVQGSTITLNGAQAEKYVRSRDITVLGSNNLRMERQTQFIRAMFTQVGKNGGAAKNYDTLMSAAGPYMTTDMDADSMKALSDYEMNDEIEKVPGEVRAGEAHDEFYVDDDGLYKLILQVFYKATE